MVESTLGEAGLEVVVAPDAASAFELAQTRAFRLVLTDVHMPGMNGLALVRALRGLDSYRYVPILVLTTADEPEMKVQGKEAGATGWLVKPVSPISLVSTVLRVLG